MAEFLSQDEIDRLLDFADGIDEDRLDQFEIFLYVRNPQGKYEIIELKYDDIKDWVTDNRPVGSRMVKLKLQGDGYKIIFDNLSKSNLVKNIHHRFKEFEDAEKELVVMKDYLDQFPEYII